MNGKAAAHKVSEAPTPTMTTLMKILACALVLVSTVTAFAPLGATTTTNHALHSAASETVETTRRAVVTQSTAAAAALLVTGTLAVAPPSAYARGRATLEQSYERYAPRIKAGGAFYGKELRSLVERGDFKGVAAALAEPPKREKSDLLKPDAGVAERARLAGGFSNARVLVAADLFAAAFSESSVSKKTRTMQAAVEKVRGIVAEMESIAKQGTGEESGGGGLFGLGGGKKASPQELQQKLRELYVLGGNGWNEYVFAANENLALQFDKFEYIK